MPGKKYIIALDQGTSSCRAILFDLEASVVGIEQQTFTQHFPKAGWVEHDPIEIWEVQYKMLKQLCEKHQISGEEIDGIGITNQRETTVLWHRRTGKPFYNAIVWQDRRTSNFCNRLKEDGLEKEIHQRTGLVIDAYFSASKINWIINHVPGAREAMDNDDLCAGTIDSWLIYNLSNGKKFVTDHTNASRTMLYNLKTKSWDNRLCEIFNIAPTCLAEIQDSSSLFCNIKLDGCEVPVCGVAGDQQAALYGQGCFNIGEAKNTYGTGCFMLMQLQDNFILSEKGLLTTVCCDANGKPAYALEGSVFVAGAAIQWLRDELDIIQDTKETSKMALSIKNKFDVFVVPAFTGLGTPYWDMRARGAILGLTRGTTKEEIVKATLDAIALQTKDVLDTMESEAQIELESLYVDGGACANDYLMQFQSDILGKRVVRPKLIESTALGAALLAGNFLQIWDAQFIKEKKKIDRTFIPELEQSSIKHIYSAWKKAVSRTLNWLEDNE